MSNLSELLSEINKKYKYAAVSYASEMPEVFRVKTGIPAIDWCCTGGLPVNRIIEFYGPFSSGKTYTAMVAIAKFQKVDWRTKTLDAITSVTYKPGKKVKISDTESYVVHEPLKVESIVSNPVMKNTVLIDFEGTYDADWGEQLGIDNKALIRVVPKTSEQGVDIADAYIRDEMTSLVVIDSVAIARAAAEIEKPMDEATMGMQARFWNRAMAKFQNAMNANPDKHVTVILINRAYMKIGLVFGDPEQIGGGSGMMFAKAVSLKFFANKEVKADVDGVKDVVIGRNITVTNKKNKTGKPFRKADFFLCLNDDEESDLKYGDTDVVNDLVELALINDVIKKSGSTLTFGRVSCRGREAFVKELRKKPSIVELIKQRLGI